MPYNQYSLHKASITECKNLPENERNNHSFSFQCQNSKQLLNQSHRYFLIRSKASMTFWNQKCENDSHESLKMVAVRNANKHDQTFQNGSYEKCKQK